MATEFIYEVRSDLGFKKPDSDFKNMRPNFLSEIITLARESKGPLPSCLVTSCEKFVIEESQLRKPHKPITIQTLLSH